MIKAYGSTCDWVLSNIHYRNTAANSYDVVVKPKIKNFHDLVNKTLDEYFQFRYSISNEQVMKVINNVNNFKLKHNNFQTISEHYNGKQYYYDREFLFMTVDSANLAVTTHW